MPKEELHFIVGLTAAGKTAFALEWAEKTDGMILSCDSLCVYRGMDIGTAKPSAEEQRRVPHFGLDLADPWERYSVAEYIRYRDAVLSKVRAEGRPVAVCGGSGFYLKSFFSNVVDQLEISEAVESEVQDLLASEDGLKKAVEALKKSHPASETFTGLDWQNPRRVSRALVRTLASGKTYSQLRAAFEEQPPPLPDWEKTVVWIQRPEAEMEDRNRSRVRAMLASGLMEEVKSLRALGFERNPMACGSVGYAEGLGYLDGRLSMEEMEERMVTRTRQLMRKQRNWLRHHIPASRVVRPD